MKFEPNATACAVRLLRPRMALIHLTEPRSQLPACGKADVDDELTCDPREVTCHRCQLAIPEAA